MKTVSLAEKSVLLVSVSHLSSPPSTVYALLYALSSISLLSTMSYYLQRSANSNILSSQMVVIRLISSVQ
jgi:hypothetical protein